MQPIAQKEEGLVSYKHEAAPIPHDDHGGDHHHHHAPHHGFFRTYVWSHDHKMIGMQYLFASLLFMAVSGALAMGVRWQLAFPGHPVPVIGHLLPASIANPDGSIAPGGYNALVTMHATIMIFLAIMPILIGVFGNFLIPLKIGAPDMAFPFFNALSFWLFFVSGIIMLASFFVPGGAAAGGWTSYAPLSTTAIYQGSAEAGHTYAQGQSMWALGIFINGLASIAGAANYITTIINMRCPGMTMFRLPLTVWALFITSFLLLLAVPVLSAAGAMLWFDLNAGTHFFSGDNVTGGQPLLWQHLFWFFGHPEVYIMILPAMGLVSEILPVFARKPIFGYRAMVYAIAAIGVLGFIVWGHHMFVSGMNLVLSATFSLSTMVIAVPSAIKTFNWMGTIWKGSIHFTTAMLFCLAFVILFVIGGFSGIFMAATPIDLFIHHTYHIVAHIHYVLFGGSLFAILGSIYFYFPKMFGRMMSERLGKWHFWLTFIFFNLTFFPMHNLGLAGMMRRIADPTQYEHLRNLQPLQVFVSLSAFGLGASFFLFWWNFFYSLFRGPKAPHNPWRANTLEWTLPSPITLHGNFEQTPVVYHGPYEYSVPGLSQDWLPQNMPLRDMPKNAGVAIDVE
ncbi:MAG: cbb3-type cytochrome c oxidase subunit I [Verrucomicrobia bacterium]|nr:cbb3-type cytochrome c oxidase subunit I [Verrucomicrobiota bacterium]